MKCYERAPMVVLAPIRSSAKAPGWQAPQASDQARAWRCSSNADNILIHPDCGKKKADPLFRFRAMLLSVGLALLAGVGMLPAAETDVAFTADVDGSTQRYVLATPPEFDANQPVDLLIALHGHGSDRWQFIRLERDECRAVRDFAREHRMLLVSPDYRAPTSWMGPKAESDVVQIIGQLKKQYQVRRVVLCGASMGGASCLTFAALHPQLIDAVVSMNGVANHVEYENFQDAIQQSFGGTKITAAREFRRRSAELWSHRLTMPSAFTVGGQDRSVPPDSVIRLAAQLREDGRPTRLIHRPDGGHSTTYADAMAALQFVAADAKASKPTELGLQLTLPPNTYATVNVPMAVYFDNIILSKTPESYQFRVRCKLGTTDPQRWTVTPVRGDVGRHPFTVEVLDQDGKQIASASTTLHVAAANAGHDRSVRLMIVGDSLTHATVYPNHLAKLLNAAGNPQWSMLGTHRPARAAAGVRHEGYGGWTWQRFAAKYEPKPDGTYRKRSSPFVFLDQSRKPSLDVNRYFDEACEGRKPDVVFFLLGINDCFGANPDDRANIDARIDIMLNHAEQLLADFRRAAPEADLAICITPPPNSRESGFFANYKGRYHRWGWKRIQHRLVQRLLRHFGESTQELGDDRDRIFLVPTQLNLDPQDGYPENNGVHPNEFGYQQIAASLYCWLKHRHLSSTE